MSCVWIDSNLILWLVKQRVGPSIRSGPGFCPRINATNGSSEILVPYGDLKRIQVKVDNIAVWKVVWIFCFLVSWNEV